MYALMCCLKANSLNVVLRGGGGQVELFTGSDIFAQKANYFDLR